VLEKSSTINNQNFSILIDPDVTKRFISSAMLKRIKVKVVEQDEFRDIEMESRAKQKVGGNVMECSINSRDFVMKVDLYVMILGSYDIVIGMDWLESHDVILNYNMKWLNLIDDFRHSRVDCWKEPWGVLEIYFFPTTTEE
jgi:hypothetical protein